MPASVRLNREPLESRLRMLKQKILPLVNIAVSVGLIAVLLLRADLSDFSSAFKKVNILVFAGALVFQAFNMIIRSLKWQLLLKAQGADISLLTVNNLNYMSLFFNNFFLGTIGGDAFRVYRVLGYSNNLGGAASSVILERATGFFAAILIILLFGLGFLFMYQTLVSLRLLIALFIVILITVVVVFLILKLHANLANLLILDPFPRIKKIFEESLTTIRGYKDNYWAVVFALALSFVFHVGKSFTVYFFTLAANADVSIIPLLFISPLVSLLVMIPISINGIGIQEGSYVFYLEQLGVAGPVALIVAILSRVSLFVLSLVGGLLFLMSYGGRRRTPKLVKQKEALS